MPGYSSPRKEKKNKIAQASGYELCFEGLDTLSTNNNRPALMGFPPSLETQIGLVPALCYGALLVFFFFWYKKLYLQLES
jgi:hypothetical protein